MVPEKYEVSPHRISQQTKVKHIGFKWFRYDHGNSSDFTKQLTL